MVRPCGPAALGNEGDPNAELDGLRGSCRLHFADDGFEVSERFVHRQGIHLPAQSFAGGERSFQIMSRNFNRQLICDELARAFLVLDPRGMRKRYPDFASIDQKLNVDRVGVPRRNGHNQRLVDAVYRLLGPAVGGGEILEHPPKL